MFFWCTALAVAGDAVTLGLQLEPPGLDPTISADSAIGEVVFANLFEGLTRSGADGAVHPWLAESWRVSADGTQYVFRLRRGVRFHTGAPFDAQSVKFTLDRALSTASVNPQKETLAAVASVDILDPYIVRIALKSPDAGLPFALSLPAFVMVEPGSAAGNVRLPVGTGPFRFESWQRGASVSLIRNPQYWGPPPHIKRAIFKFIANPAGADAAVRSGDVDIFPDFPAPENIAALKHNPRLKVVIGTTEGQIVLAINNHRPPFDNLLVRRAVSYALNRADIVNGAFYGYGVPIGSHYAPQDEGYADLTGRYPYNPAEARRLLATAGYSRGFAVTLKLPPPPYARRSGEIVAAELAAVGIKVRIENIEWAQWLSQVFKDRDFDLTVVNHIEPLDYDIYGRDDYYFGYRNGAFKQLFARLQTASGKAERLKLLAAIQSKIADDAVNGFLFELPKLTVQRADLRGFAASAMVPTNDVSQAYFTERAGGAVAALPGGIGGIGWLFGAAVLLLAGFAVMRTGFTYVAARCGYLGLTLFAASLVVFAAMQVLPGDPASFMLGLDASPQTVANLHRQLGLDAPLVSRYVAWIGGMLHGDFGVSYTYQVPVSDLLAERIALSLPLIVAAMGLSAALALPFGLLAAYFRKTPLGQGLSLLTQLGVALPDFWLGILLVLVFAIGLNWFPSGGFPGWQAGSLPALHALVLPALALAVPQAAILARVLRDALAEALEADYIRTARAKGAGRLRVLVRHALPNALIPALTVLGMQFSFLLAGTIFVENVFSLPGLGRLLSQAIAQRDLIVVQSAVMLLVLAAVLVSFAVDIAYAAADPRLKGGRR